MKHQLLINFSEKALDTLGEQSKQIVLVKESKEAAPIAKASIVWFTTVPFQQVEISWEEEFYLYGSQTEFHGDAVIKKTSITGHTLEDGIKNYNFGPNAANFKSVDYNGDRGTYYMKNLFPEGKFTLFGLAQKISSGATTVINPINAVKSIYNDNLGFTPVERIRVFMQEDVEDSKVLTRVTSDPIVLDFTGKEACSIEYNTASNHFVEM